MPIVKILVFLGINVAVVYYLTKLSDKAPRGAYVVSTIIALCSLTSWMFDLIGSNVLYLVIESTLLTFLLAVHLIQSENPEDKDIGIRVLTGACYILVIMFHDAKNPIFFFIPLGFIAIRHMYTSQQIDDYKILQKSSHNS